MHWRSLFRHGVLRAVGVVIQLPLAYSGWQFTQNRFVDQFLAPSLMSRRVHRLPEALSSANSACGPLSILGAAEPCGPLGSLVTSEA